MRNCLTIAAFFVLVACSDGGGEAVSPPPDLPDANPAAGTRPAGEAQLVTLEGRVGEGAECPTLTTPDGVVWALSPGNADLAAGDYVQITGEVMDASICMQGEGTLLVGSASMAEPPARDRDPARAGGIALSESYVTGSWVAKGLNADCDRPDFQITESPGAIVIETAVNNVPETGRIVLGDYPRIDWDDPLLDMPIESRGPDGLAILRPATDAAYEPMKVGGALVEDDGAVFIKCA